MNNFLLTAAFVVLLQLTVLGQSTSSDSSGVKTPIPKTVVAPEPEAEVKDGIWAVGEYLGKKLANELGDRMNLGETTEPEPRKPRKVTLKIGPIKIERFE